MKSKFASWFKDQFGVREFAFRDKSDDELREIIESGQHAQYELDHRRSWDQNHRAAMYGWNARPTEASE